MYNATIYCDNLNNVFRNKKYAQIFNIYISTEKEDSMSPEIKKNSLLIGCKVKNVNNLYNFIDQIRAIDSVKDVERIFI